MLPRASQFWPKRVLLSRVLQAHRMKSRSVKQQRKLILWSQRGAVHSLVIPAPAPSCGRGCLGGFWLGGWGRGGVLAHLAQLCGSRPWPRCRHLELRCHAPHLSLTPAKLRCRAERFRSRYAGAILNWGVFAAPLHTRSPRGWPRWGDSTGLLRQDASVTR